MKASAYFVRLAARATRPPNGMRAAFGAQAFVLRAVVRLHPRAAPSADLRALRRKLAWQLPPIRRVAEVPTAPPSILLRHTQRVQMFALTPIERVIQASAAPRLPEWRLPASSGAVTDAIGVPTLIDRTSTIATNTLINSTRHSLHVQPGQWQQTCLRIAALNSGWAAALPSAQSSASPVIKPARAGESSAPAWLTPRLQKILQQHFSIIGRAPAKQQLLTVPSVALANAQLASTSRAPLDVAAASTPALSTSRAPYDFAVDSTPALSASIGTPPSRVEVRSTLLPQRRSAMFYPAQAKLKPSPVLASRIAPSLSARPVAFGSPQGAAAQVGKMEFASFATSTPINAAVAVAQANAAADGFGAVAGAARFMPSSALASAKPQALLSAGTPSVPSARTPNNEQEWVQAVQRVIFTRHVLDKVTDDVVNKIEKRLRIERERRGI